MVYDTSSKHKYRNSKQIRNSNFKSVQSAVICCEFLLVRGFGIPRGFRRISMADMPRFRFPELILLLMVVAVAGGARAWYVMAATNNGSEPAPFQVQGPGPQPDYEAGTRLR